jgi:hypothetical protein
MTSRLRFEGTGGGISPRPVILGPATDRHALGGEWDEAALDLFEELRGRGLRNLGRH